MNNKTADALELKTGCLPIEFDGTEGLFVFIELRTWFLQHGLHGR